MKALHILLLLPVVLLAACDTGGFLRGKSKPAEIAVCDPSRATCPDVLTPDDSTIRPKYRGGEAPPLAEGFVTGQEVEALDRTSEAEIAEAKEIDTAGEVNLGRTVAALGDVAEAGLWLKTPLVLAEQDGRIVWADSGASINVRLMPSAGETGSGSQISLAAMRALGVPLTALAELIVFGK